MPGQPEFVFPAVDSLLSQQSSGTIDVNGIKNSIQTSENHNLTDSINLADTNSSQALVYGMYLSRNKTIADAAVNMTKQNKMYDNGASQTLARQGEINEWEAQNKFDTLFFLQCLFLYLMLFVILIFVWRKGLLPGSTYYWIIAILTIIVIGILWNRARYTNVYRDNRYWNRRYLALDSSLDDKTSECSAAPETEAPSVDENSVNPV